MNAIVNNGNENNTNTNDLVSIDLGGCQFKAAHQQLIDYPLAGFPADAFITVAFEAFEDVILIKDLMTGIIHGSVLLVGHAAKARWNQTAVVSPETLYAYLEDISNGHRPCARLTEEQCRALFELHWKAADEVAYNPAWANGTGYFNPLVGENDRIAHPMGNSARFTDPQGRRGIVLWDSLCNRTFVVFERYAPGSANQRLVYNASMWTYGPRRMRTGQLKRDPGASGTLRECGYLTTQMEGYLQLGSVKERLAKAS